MNPPRYPRTKHWEKDNVPGGFQPYLPLVRVDFGELVREAQALVLGVSRIPVQVYFRNQETFATIKHNSRRAEISIHPIIDHPQTPAQVFRHIVIHEHIHLAVPPREIEGKIKHHPPEFWEMERALLPEGDKVCFWLFIRFTSYLKRDSKRERTLVSRGWRKIAFLEGLSWEQTLALAESLSPDALSTKYKLPI